MSVLYLLAYAAIWFLVGWLFFYFWRRWKPIGRKRKMAQILIGFLLFSIWFGGAFWEVAGKKMYWDAKVRELCAKDGGIKVFKKVELPADVYKQYARRNWILPDKSEVNQTDEYYVEWNFFYYHKGNPQVSRSETRIIRRSDGKVLGKYISYGRGGGDLPGPWHGSSFTCPNPVKLPNFETSIFQKGG